jgi:hypothetical protein
MPNHGQAIKPRVKLGKRPDDCWEWLGHMTECGHGKLTFCGRDTLAHRWMWEMLFGPIPRGLVVYSTCDKKACVNPHHLACGTQADANRSSIQTKLLPADVAEIKAEKDTRNAHTARMLAERYGVSEQTIRDIWRGGSWARARKNFGPRRQQRQK